MATKRSDQRQADARREALDAFNDLVNMTPKQLRDWLETDESRSVGQREREGTESTGHQEGRRIVALLEKKPTDHDDDDEHHLRRVAGYIRRHLAQRPDGDVARTNWRYSLMNWGHDPLKG